VNLTEHDYLAREQRARKNIDEQLAAAGWVIQSGKQPELDETGLWEVQAEAVRT
jgi:hypothetical protein